MAQQQVKLHKPPEGSFKMRVIRSLTSLPQITLDSMPKVTVVKKKVNIPICDTRVDADYDNIVKPTFQLPQSYIRHIRRIGDEADVSADCIVDLDDKVSALFQCSQCRCHSAPALTHHFPSNYLFQHSSGFPRPSLRAKRR